MTRKGSTARAVHPSSTGSSSMPAVVQDRYGSAELLRIAQVARPAIADDEILVRVRAAGVHIGDWHVMTGRPYLMRMMGFGFRAPKARTRGTDVAGTVEAVGQNVAKFDVGDDVFGTADGSFAAYAAAGPATLAAKPPNLTFEQAAAVPTSACVALQALRTGGIASGQRVLIIGASGGVGMFAVQIAKCFGAEVTGVCSTAKVEMVRSAGADRVIDYTREEVTATDQAYDMIIDLGGLRPLSQLRQALTPRGTAVLVGGEGRGRWIGAALGRSLRALLLAPFVSQRLKMIFGRANAKDLRLLGELIETDRVAPVIARTYSLTEAADAIDYAAAGSARGKVVITVS